MTRLAPLDLAIIAVYILGMTLLGARFARAQKDLRTYFVGGRNVGWFLVLMSIVATETSAVTFLSVPGLAYKNDGNLTYLQLSFGYIIGRTVVAWVLLPMYMRGDLFSAYEVLKQKFGPSVQRVASGIFLLTRTIADGLRLFLTALLMQYTGLSIEQSILFVGVVTILYTYLGGMKAVLWTDLIQFAVKIAGAALAGVFVLRLLPGGWDQLLTAGEAANKFRLFDFDHVTDPGYPYNFWAGVVGGAVFSMASHGADQLMVQRYLCARTLGQARAALVLSGITVTVQFTLFLLVGVGMFALREAGLFDTTIVQPDADGNPVPRAARSDEVFGLFIVRMLPTGVVGVLVAAVLAAAMSTLSSSLNSSANALVTDFYRPLRPGRDERHYVLLSRVTTAVWGLAQMGVAVLAYRSGSDKSVVDQVLTVAGLTTGLLLGLFVLGRMARPVSSAAALTGLLAGAAVVVGVWLPQGVGAVPGLAARLPKQMSEPILAWPWFALVGASVTVAAALLVSSFAPPRPAGPDGHPPTPAN